MNKALFIFFRILVLIPMFLILFLFGLRNTIWQTAMFLLHGCEVIPYQKHDKATIYKVYTELVKLNGYVQKED